MQVNDINDSARGSARRMHPLLDLFIVRRVEILLEATNHAQLRTSRRLMYIISIVTICVVFGFIIVNIQQFTFIPRPVALCYTKPSKL